MMAYITKGRKTKDGDTLYDYKPPAKPLVIGRMPLAPWKDRSIKARLRRWWRRTFGFSRGWK